jgi:hypothetical protein
MHLCNGAILPEPFYALGVSYAQHQNQMKYHDLTPLSGLIFFIGSCRIQAQPHQSLSSLENIRKPDITIRDYWDSKASRWVEYPGLKKTYDSNGKNTVNDYQG